MHLARRGYVLVFITALLGIVGVWSAEPQLAHLWTIPAGFLCVGLAWERVLGRRARLDAGVTMPTRALLGREQPAAFTFGNPTSRPATVEYAPVAPSGFAPLEQVRRVRVESRQTVADPVTFLPVRLGPQTWPQMPARIRGALALAWWTQSLPIDRRVVVAPDARREDARIRGLGDSAGARRATGAGVDLHQLRGYVQGDPLARVDWKASARSRALITREYAEDQHLDVVIAVDAGRLSRLRCGALDRFGHYSNLAARFAEIVTRRDDRIGLVVYADRVLATCAPARGTPAVIRLRRALEEQSVQIAESDPAIAAVSVRRLLKHRALVVLMTDLDDASVAHQLARAVRLLSPPHLVMACGIQSQELEEMECRAARDWRDPYVSLAAAEQRSRTTGQIALLQRLGAPVVSAPADRLEAAVLQCYEMLRRRRRI
jgi:uncharacterized protein (DUF58 family)